jgi:hypothetical protein
MVQREAQILAVAEALVVLEVVSQMLVGLMEAAAARLVELPVLAQSVLFGLVLAQAVWRVHSHQPIQVICK